MTVSRRFFLKGLGATVAIPVLPSLLTPRAAQAQAAATPRPCFVGFWTDHGGIAAENMFPAAPATGVETRTYAGRTIRRFPLTATRTGTVATVCPVLAAPSDVLTDGLLGKMFTIQGVGIPWYIAHTTGAWLGNYAARCDHKGVPDAEAPRPRRTVDQIMAASSGFYPATPQQPVMVTSGDTSYNYSNPVDPTSAIQAESPFDTPGQLFDALFPNQGTPTQRPPIVNRVRDAYQRLRLSPRISRLDRDRLDAHIARLDQVERRLGAIAQCGAVPRPTSPWVDRTSWNVPELDPAAHAQYYQLFNDIYVLALSCGASRIAVSRLARRFSAYAADWHQQVAHLFQNPEPQAVLAAAQQRVFADVVVDLASKLDAVDMGDGTTLLDRTLVMWTQESGNQTHDSATLPVVGFGGAQGFLRTGYHVDYRNLTLPLQNGDPAGFERYGGLVWNQWLGTVLQAMRIPRAEWENTAVCGGYPDYAYANAGAASFTAQAWPASVWTAAGEVLPWMAAT